MKLLLVNYEFPPVGAGAGNATEQTARQLAGMGHEAVVLTAAHGQLPKREDRHGFTILRAPALRRRPDRCTPPEMLSFSLGGVYSALSLARGWRPDACLCYFTLPGAPVGWALRRFFGVPYAVLLRGGDVPGFEPARLARLHRLCGPVISSLWRDASAVSANCHWLAALARRHLPEVEVGVIPNGVDTQTFTPTGSRARDGSIHLLFVGRLASQKGVDVLLQSMAQLAQQDAENGMQPFRLSLVGDGPLKSELERTVHELGLSRSVSFLGWRRRDELPGLFDAADIFVLPSRDEGMPNVLLEAMSSGLPVVASRAGGSSEVVRHGKTGLLVVPDDVQALAQALGRLRADAAARADMGREARRLACEEYSWSSVARGVEQLAQATVEDTAGSGVR